MGKFKGMENINHTITCPHCSREFDASKIIFDRVKEDAKLAAQKENTRKVEMAAKDAYRKGQQKADEEKQAQLTQALQTISEMLSEMKKFREKNQAR